MKILITGGAGFIGSSLADRLKTTGHQVRGLDNYSTGNNHWDGLDLDDVAREFAFDNYEPQDVIVHCAASYDDRLKWHRDTDTNVAGGINVAIAARKWGARVVYFQTALIYGQNPYAATKQMLEAMSEDPYLPLSTTAPVNPENSYAISKYAAGQYLRHADIPLLELRLANIYGPRNLSGPAPAFYKRITERQPCTITDTRRDFVYIDDLVNLVVQAINAEATGTYHVSTGRDYAIGQLYDAVVDACDAYDGPAPVFVERAADDAPTILLDPSATKRDFGWEATTDLVEGIDHAVAWYREHGVTDTYTHLSTKG